jgi:hypothetical protein
MLYEMMLKFWHIYTSSALWICRSGSLNMCVCVCVCLPNAKFYSYKLNQHRSVVTEYEISRSEVSGSSDGTLKTKLVFSWKYLTDIIKFHYLMETMSLDKIA